MKILLLSAYDADSHKYWRQSLVSQFPNYEWTVLTLPGRFFSWRIRGNSLSWAFNEKKTLTADYDLIIATSMTDLSSLKGLCPKLANTPCLVYFHENQFSYPRSGKEYNSVEPLILNIYTALAGDMVVFNSDWNQRSFMDGMERLLKKLPDQVPNGLRPLIEAKSRVIPVPLTQGKFVSHLANSQPKLNILWNHRWEFDKGPELLLATIQQLKQQTSQFTFHLAGQQFKQTPDIFTQIQSELGSNLGHTGYLDSKADYQKLMASSDIVLSTADHDFQGLSILEAMAAGCIPVVPNRLAYPEYVPAQYRYSEQQEDKRICDMLLGLLELKKQKKLPVAPSVDQFSWQHLKNRYQQAIIECSKIKPA